MNTTRSRTSSLPFSSIVREENEISNRPLAIGIGEVLWDILPSGTTLGGAPANFAYACTKLGAYSSIISRVGADDLGIQSRKKLSQAGIFLNGLTADNDHPTGTVEVSLKHDGTPEYTFPDNVAWDYLAFDDLSLKLVEQADIITFGTLAQRTQQNRDAISYLLEKASPNALIVFDTNIRQDLYTDEIIRNSVHMADVLKVNTSELKAVLKATGIHGETEELALQRLVSNYSLKVAALTKGTTGSIIVTPNSTSSLTSFRVEVKDTIGAGDAFTAALTLGLHQGWDLNKAHRKAAIVASYVCTQQGAMPYYPDGLRIFA